MAFLLPLAEVVVEGAEAVFGASEAAGGATAAGEAAGAVGEAAASGSWKKVAQTAAKESVENMPSSNSDSNDPEQEQTQAGGCTTDD